MVLWSSFIVSFVKTRENTARNKIWDKHNSRYVYVAVIVPCSVFWASCFGFRIKRTLWFSFIFSLVVTKTRENTKVEMSCTIFAVRICSCYYASFCTDALACQHWIGRRNKRKLKRSWQWNHSWRFCQKLVTRFDTTFVTFICPSSELTWVPTWGWSKNKNKRKI